MLNLLNEARRRHEFLLLGFVVMPDHAHVVIVTRTCPLPEIMHSWKLRSALAIGKSRVKKGPVWQARYFDYICRRARDVSEKLEYVHQNPVSAGLVEHPDEWRWSSASFYLKTRTTFLVPDSMDFSGDPDELLWPAPWRVP